jgi:hypothetical protein
MGILYRWVEQHPVGSIAIFALLCVVQQLTGVFG